MNNLSIKSIAVISFNIGLLAILCTGAWAYHHMQTEQQLEGPKAPSITEWTPKTGEQSPTPPNALNLALPFFSQAPHGNWDYPWQEACEEASVALIENQYHKRNFTADTFNDELLKIVNFEMETWNAYEHTTMSQTAQILKNMYGIETATHKNPTFEEVQTILSQGHFIIWPSNGKSLMNPNFKNGGPNYHVLVVKGYDSASQQIVTNDVGTRRGADYVYSWDVIENALHDYHDTDMNQGEKIILEVLPPTP